MKKKLRRKGRTEIRKTPLRFYEIAYINKSPNYCDRDDKKGILFFEGYWWYTIVKFVNFRKLNKLIGTEKC